MSLAKKLADLPQAAVRQNKILINRVYELAGFREALAYRDDPEIEALISVSDSDEVGKERRRMITETGWGQFKDTRDAMYGKDK